VHSIKFHPSAARELEKLERQVQRRIGRAIDGLASDPRGAGTAKLRSADDMYRLRVGDYRVVYQVRDAVLLVLVIRVRHRRGVPMNTRR
jgi:mRNA interferase RelE/StbE